MKIIEKLIRLWSINSDKIEQNSDTLHKATIFNFYSTITNSLLFIFSIINVIQGNFLNFFIVSSIFIILLINHFHFITKFQLKTSLTIYTLAISTFFLWLIFAGNIYNQGILVFGFFPLSIIGLILPYLIETIFDFSVSNIILYTLIFTGSLIFINIYLKLFEQKQNKLIGEKNEAKKETLAKENFISKISHQIRTPLNNIVVVTK